MTKKYTLNITFGTKPNRVDILTRPLYEEEYNIVIDQLLSPYLKITHPAIKGCRYEIRGIGKTIHEVTDKAFDKIVLRIEEL
jgi:hypothetical protein